MHDASQFKDARDPQNGPPNPHDGRYGGGEIGHNGDRAEVRQDASGAQNNAESDAAEGHRAEGDRPESGNVETSHESHGGEVRRAGSG